MTNKYHSRGDRPPSPGHPSCVPADKEKIVNCFYMRLITDLCGYKKKKENVREHTNSWENISPPLLLAEGGFNKPFHERRMEPNDRLWAPSFSKRPNVYRTTLMKIEPLH